MPGLTRAFAILISSGGVLLSGDTGLDSADVVWYPKPEAKPLAEFNVFLSSSGVTITDWPGKRAMGTEYVGSLSLANQETAWVVAHDSDTVMALPSAHIPLLEGETKQEAVVRLFGRGPYDNIRGMAYGKSDDGLRWLYESATLVGQ